jgi:hypothetical protein
MKIKMIILGMSLMLAYGCASAPLKIETDMTGKEYQVMGTGEGSSTGIMLFNVIPIGQNDRFVTAYRNAVMSMGGDALLNPTITERWFWAYVLNGYTTTIRGTVIKIKNKDASSEKSSGKPSQANSADRLEKLKNLRDSGMITQEEYDKKRKEILDAM